MLASNFLLGVPGLLKKLYNQQTSGVKSVQQGVATAVDFAGGGICTETISAVNPAKTIVIAQPHNVAYTAGVVFYHGSATLISATSIQVIRNIDTQSVAWQVIEFY